jgi:hypothetical protein
LLETRQEQADFGDLEMTKRCNAWIALDSKYLHLDFDKETKTYFIHRQDIGFWFEALEKAQMEARD